MPAHAHHPRRSRPGRTAGFAVRHAGLFIAFGVALLALSLVFYVASRTRPGTPAASDPVKRDIGAPPDVRAEPGARMDIGLVGTAGARVQFADSRDPSRIAGELQWSATEPLEAGRSIVTDPRAWIYLRDGKAVHIRADHARIYIPPKAREPESGRFEGGVIARLFEPARGATIDPERDPPIATLTTASMNFDTAVGELATTDPVRVTTDRIDLDASDLRVLFDQVSQRVVRLDIAHGRSLRYLLDGPSRAPLASDTAAAPPDSSPSLNNSERRPIAARTETTRSRPVSPIAASSITPPAPLKQSDREDLYIATCSGDVRVVVGTGVLRADALDTWFRLLNNGLPKNAIAGGRSLAARTSGSGTPSSPGNDEARTPAAFLLASVLPTQPFQPPLHEDSHQPTAPDRREAVLTWNGPLVLTPIDGKPPELERDHVSIRFRSNAEQGVTFEDSRSGAYAAAQTLDYGATSRTASIRAAGNVTGSTFDLGVGRAGRLLATRLWADLNSGLARIDGPGSLIAFERGAVPRRDSPRRIDWSDRADFQFETDDSGTITDRIQGAAFLGSVTARDDRASVSGDNIEAWFSSRRDDRASDSDPPTLARVLVRGPGTRAVARSGDHSLSALALDTRFAPPHDSGNDPVPESVLAIGSVEADQPGGTLRANSLLASLTRDSAGRIVVESARAWGGGSEVGDLTFIRPDGLTIRAAELAADVTAERVDLLGEHVTIERDRALITGTQMRLEGIARQLTVFGAGEFTARLAGRAGTPDGSVHASWSRSMLVNDRSGYLECWGDAHAVSRPEPTLTESLSAEFVRLDFEPAPERTADSLAGPDRDPPRRVRLVQARGASTELEGGARATLESLRLRADDDGNPTSVIEQRTYLESDRFEADNAAGTVTVPTAGRLLVQDLRDDAPHPTSGSASDLPLGGTSSRGTSRFTWDGSLTIDRAAGRIDMARRVSLLHRPLTSDEVVSVESEHLAAFLDGRGFGPNAATSQSKPRLVRAEARDAVAIQSGERQLIADFVTYDAAARTAEAETRSAESLVTFFDPQRGVPVRARRLFWDFAAGRIEVREPAPTVIPR
ncbi:MAG: hypothetical protein JNM07_11690 [Phycisphaerae bacterium]|nr:hypothetical protein [Phycisphaerae bacterium]